MNLDKLLSVVMIIAVVGISSAFLLDVFEDTQDDLACPEGYTFNVSATSSTACYEATNHSNETAILSQGTALDDTITAVANVTSKSGTLTTVIMAGAVISVLIGAFYLALR